MNIFKNRCLFMSEILYFLYKKVDRKNDYKINILLKFYKEFDNGHAWLTRNGKDFLDQGKGFDESVHVMIGENKKYRYYVRRRNFELWSENRKKIFKSTNTNG